MFLRYVVEISQVSVNIQTIKKLQASHRYIKHGPEIENHLVFKHNTKKNILQCSLSM